MAAVRVMCSLKPKTMVAVALALAASATLATPAAANPVRSLYTTIEFKSCRQTPPQHGESAAWICPGLPDWPVYVGEGDRHQFLSFGTDPEKRKAATQTLKAANTIFKGKKSRATIEWRLAAAVQPGVQARPLAVIVRHFTSQDAQRGEVLVIYKVTPSESCEIGIIDALANKDANALARSAADELAARASCGAPPRTFGQTGKSPL